MAHHVVYQEPDYDLTYELKKCKECSCSRCSLNGTPGCYIEIAIKEINRYEQAMDSIKKIDEWDDADSEKNYQIATQAIGNAKKED